METVMDIAHAILVIGGALCIVLLVLLLLSALSMVWKVNGLIRDFRYKYEIMQHYLVMPFKRLSRFLDDDED